MVRTLDPVEASSLCYLIAFDLDSIRPWHMRSGTEHPGVGWSEHIQPQMRNPSLPGPDGIGTIAPLVSTGLVDPEDARGRWPPSPAASSATTARSSTGMLALKNHGSHYGFIEHGVVFSKLQPGLATIVVLDDGSDCT